MMTKKQTHLAIGAAVVAVVLVFGRRAYARGVGSGKGESFDPNWGRVIRLSPSGASEFWFPEAYFGLGKWGGSPDLEKYGAHEPSIRAGHNVQ